MHVVGNKPAVPAVAGANASVDVTLRDSHSQRLVAKGRYTEQAPHARQGRASAYLRNGIAAAKSAVQRLQTAAEHALHRDNSNTAGQLTNQTGRRNGSSGQSVDQSGSETVSDLRNRTMASFGQARASVRAAAQRLQHAADNALRSSSAEPLSDARAKPASEVNINGSCVATEQTEML